MINSDKKVAKVAKEYICECCDYKCFRKNDFNKHLSTAKHKKLQNPQSCLAILQPNASWRDEQVWSLAGCLAGLAEGASATCGKSIVLEPLAEVTCDRSRYLKLTWKSD